MHMADIHIPLRESLLSSATPLSSSLDNLASCVTFNLVGGRLRCPSYKQHLAFTTTGELAEEEEEE